MEMATQTKIPLPSVQAESLKPTVLRSDIFPPAIDDLVSVIFRISAPLTMTPPMTKELVINLMTQVVAIFIHDGAKC